MARVVETIIAHDPAGESLDATLWSDGSIEITCHNFDAYHPVSVSQEGVKVLVAALQELAAKELT